MGNKSCLRSTSNRFLRNILESHSESGILDPDPDPNPKQKSNWAWYTRIYQYSFLSAHVPKKKLNNPVVYSRFIIIYNKPTFISSTLLHGYFYRVIHRLYYVVKRKVLKGSLFYSKKNSFFFVIGLSKTTLYMIQIVFQKLKKSQLTYNHIYVEKFRHKKKHCLNVEITITWA